MRWLAVGLLVCGGCSLLVGDDGTSATAPTPYCTPFEDPDRNYVQFCFSADEVSSPTVVAPTAGASKPLNFDAPIEAQDGQIELVEPTYGVAQISSVIDACVEHDAITVELLARPSPGQPAISGSPRRIVEIDQNHAVQYLVLGTEPDTDQVVVRSNGSQNEAILAAAIRDDSPTHVTLVLGSTNTIYIDGTAFTAPLVDLPAPSDWNRVAARDAFLNVADTGGDSARNWLGELFYLGIYCRELTAEQVAAHEQALVEGQ